MNSARKVEVPVFIKYKEKEEIANNQNMSLQSSIVGTAITMTAATTVALSVMYVLFF